jgi:hypothetical protein
VAKFQFSKDTQDKVTLFEQSDSAFKAAWGALEQKISAELQYLDSLREDRNAKLDEAKRAIRTESVEADITENKSLRIGTFSVQKKWSNFYTPEKFVALLKDKGLYDGALSAKIVAEKIEIAKFDVAKQFLENEGVLTDFEECEDGQELTPAVSGPKPIPPLGAELKESK